MKQAVQKSIPIKIELASELSKEKFDELYFNPGKTFQFKFNLIYLKTTIIYVLYIII